MPSGPTPLPVRQRRPAPGHIRPAGIAAAENQYTAYICLRGEAARVLNGAHVYLNAQVTGRTRNAPAFTISPVAERVARARAGLGEPPHKGAAPCAPGCAKLEPRSLAALPGKAIAGHIAARAAGWPGSCTPAAGVSVQAQWPGTGADSPGRGADSALT